MVSAGLLICKYGIRNRRLEKRRCCRYCRSVSRLTKRQRYMLLWKDVSICVCAPLYGGQLRFRQHLRCTARQYRHLLCRDYRSFTVSVHQMRCEFAGFHLIQRYIFGDLQHFDLALCHDYADTCLRFSARHPSTSMHRRDGEWEWKSILKGKSH